MTFVPYNTINSHPTSPHRWVW